MAPGWFVDLHSHVVPSGDDGAQSMEEGAARCEGAARHGTRTLFATPHVASHLPPDEERETLVAERVEELRARSGIDLRLGWELTPIAALLEEDPRRYAFEGLDVVLMEVPFTGSADLLVALAEHTEAAGLTPLVAHPERTEAVLERPALAAELAERGWPLQVNATSLLGRHGWRARGSPCTRSSVRPRGPFSTARPSASTSRSSSLTACSGPGRARL